MDLSITNYDFVHIECLVSILYEDLSITLLYFAHVLVDESIVYDFVEISHEQAF